MGNKTYHDKITEVLQPVFKPRARMMLLLGDQLIRDAGIAVFELIKNAYDADATGCIITLNNIDQDDESGSIIVEDDGHGMDLRTVLDVWLEPGTEFRKKQREKGKRTPLYERLPMGEKGVGRFAAHKLGYSIKLITRKAKQQEIVIDIDWRKFEDDCYLSDIPVNVIERKPELFRGSKTGTRIEITDLRDKPWTRRRTRELWRAVSSICSPFAGPDNFVPMLQLEPENDWLAGLIQPEEALKYSIFHFQGVINGKTLSYNYSFNPKSEMDRVSVRKIKIEDFPLLSEEPFESNSPDKLNKAKKYNLPNGVPERSRDKGYVIDTLDSEIGPINVEFYIYDLENRALKLTTSDPKGLKDYLFKNGGVRVYRSGVRVYDFGEPGNDWLNLGGKRVNVPTKRIGNNQIIGCISLDQEKSTGLIEKTNREGFVENRAYYIFREAIGCAIAQAAAERNTDKECLRIAYSPTKSKEPVIDELEQLRSEVHKRKLDDDLGPIIDRVIIEYQQVMERLLTAAGAGMNLAAVLHQVDKEIRYLRVVISQGAEKEELEKVVQRLGAMTDGLAWLLRDSPKKKQKAIELVKNALDVWKFRYEHHAIEVTNGFDLKDPEFEFTGSRRLILTAIMNLIDNSIYWLRTRSCNRKLYVGTTFEMRGHPSIVIADNGPGILDSPHLITEPFFTRKPNGMGLGLHIASEIMKQHNGRLCFPEVNDITLPKEFTGAIICMEFGGQSK